MAKRIHGEKKVGQMNLSDVQITNIDDFLAEQAANDGREWAFEATADEVERFIKFHTWSGAQFELDETEYWCEEFPIDYGFDDPYYYDSFTDH